LKDFYDIWMLSRTFDFSGEVLAEAVEKTFESRNTRITVDPMVFTSSFADDTDKNIQWKGFIRKARLVGAPETFREVVTAVNAFLEPLVISLADRQTFSRTWNAPGPWR